MKGGAKKMKRIIQFIFVLMLGVCFAVPAVLADDYEQNATVDIGEVIVVTLDPPVADFGILYPGDTKAVNITVDSTGSNVEVTVDSVGVNNGGTIFDDLLFNGNIAGSFVPLTIPAFDSGLITLTLNVPLVVPAGPQEDVIVYTITGPTP